MATVFDYVKIKRPPKATFDLSHERKLSFNMGELVPMLLEEIVPGDHFKVDSQIMLRLAPMLAPIMHRVNVFVHYFFVPTRLVWDNFNDFMTGGDDGSEAPLYPFYTINQANSGNFRKGTLPDYYGVPVTTTTAIVQDATCSAIPFRGYNLIFNEFYRDQNLQPKLPISADVDGDDPGVFSGTQMQTRAWEKDYFTSAQPTAQKGPSVALPITVNYKTQSDVLLTGGTDAAGALTAVAGKLEAPTNSAARIENIDDAGGFGVNINELRTATRVQEWLELAQRGGSRIQEITRNFFGVTPDDLRLQVPQYLGGGKQSIVISEVLNTAGTNDPIGDPTDMQAVGELAGHGISMGSNNKFSKKFKEHGYIHGIVSVLPRTAYQQGMHRHWSRREKFDFYWPQFAQLGEQEILNKEIFSDYENLTAGMINDETFGYAGRYSEMKYGCSSVHGEMRDTLSYWHMGQIYAIPPTLNADFIKSDPTHRIFAVDDPAEDKLFCQIFNRIKAVRPMPYFNDPTL